MSLQLFRRVLLTYISLFISLFLSRVTSVVSNTHATISSSITSVVSNTRAIVSSSITSVVSRTHTIVFSSITSVISKTRATISSGVSRIRATIFFSISSVVSNTRATASSSIFSIAKSVSSFLKSSWASCKPVCAIPALIGAAIASYVTRKFVSVGFSTYLYSAVEGFRSVQSFQDTMEPKADRLLQILRDQNASIDAKVESLLAIKADIKQNNVPENALPPLFDAIKLGISSHYTRYCGAAFSTLGNLVKRLFSQEQQRLIATFARILIPILLDRLGDQKERIRTHAFHAFVDIWPASQREVEDAVLGTALTGKNPRAKQTAISWLSHMARNHGLAFRCYVPDVVRCLENADVSVRDTAKNALVELFMDENDESKTFLKSELEKNANGLPRKPIRDWILEQIGPFKEIAPPGMERAFKQREEAAGRKDQRRADDELRLAAYENRLVTRELMAGATQTQADKLKHRLHIGESSNTDQTTLVPRRQDPPRSKTPLAENAQQLQRSAHTVPSQDEAEVAPLIIRSSRQLEDIFNAMTPDFDGRETEKNWEKRENHVIVLRQVVIGNAPGDYSQTFYPGIKAQLDNVFKAVLSLRTTLSSHGCYFVIDMARWLGPGIDGMVEIIVQNLFKVCVLSKKITAQNGNKAMIAVVANVSYNPRLLSHVQSATTDKSVQLRQFAAEWLRTIVNRHTSIRAAIEHGNSLNLIATCIKKGLADANPDVRNEMRHTYWDFYVAWPATANTIASDLDSKTRLLLEKDPHKPKEQQLGNPPAEESSAPAPAPAPPGKSRSALKSAIAAHRRAHQLKVKLDEGPLAVAGPSTLHSAPMRPRFRRPEGAAPEGDRDVDPSSSDIWMGLAKSEPLKPKYLKVHRRAKPVTDQEPTEGHLDQPSDSVPWVEEIRGMQPTRGPDGGPHPVEVKREEPPKQPPSPVSPLPPPQPSPKPETRAPEILPTPKSPEPSTRPSTGTGPAQSERPEYTEGPVPTQLIIDPNPRQLPPGEKLRWPVLVNPRHAPVYQPTPEEDLQFAGALLERSEEKSNRRAPVSFSPASQDPNSSQQLLDRGIQLIRSNRMDPHGFRRLRRVLESGGETEISPEQHHELVLALLNTLERGHPTVKGTSETALLPVLDVFEQTIKGKEKENNKNRFTPQLYYLTIVSFMETRGRYDASCYFSVRLDEVATRIVHAELVEGTCNSVVAILDTISNEKVQTNNNIMTMSLSLLVVALRHQNASGLCFAEDIVKRIGSLAAEQLEGVHAEARRLVVQVCIHLHAMVKEERFWELLGTPSTGSRNLLAYYLARG
ncbi:uncharacterized protein KD926_010275 [Aspergillus affinis]|uniref:uncharacterized protein n=1 Tax=Aspergillus affinis TaxID=1070780 RepID=UPI0022FDDA0B|nr:uncharacterized protein KD926_010275 [Aspergillus affinis]KAI9038819.1 hypothetical protein KD926_010275 [Aspergillus affinis]